MKILFINQNCGYFGGVEQYIADNARGLADRGHQVYLAYGNKTNKNLEEYESYFSKCFPCSELLTSQNSSAMTFSNIVESLQPDIVFAHKLKDSNFLIKMVKHFSIVRMIHDHDLCCPRKHKYYLWNGQICGHKADWRCVLDLAFLQKKPESIFKLGFFNVLAHFRELKNNRKLQCLAVGSRWMKEELLQNGFSDQQIKIHSPVVRMAIPEYIQPEGKKEFLYVGQLIKGKGIDLLLNALKNVEGDWHLNVIGEGNARANLEKQAIESGLSQKVSFCGWVPRDQLSTHYQNCLFTIVPSRWPEPFGMVGLEAMTYGRAVIGFAVGGIPDWLENEKTGLTAEAQNVQQLSSAIHRLANNPELAIKLGKAGRERLKEKFDFSDHLSKLEQTFTELIKKNSSPKRG